MELCGHYQLGFKFITAILAIPVQTMGKPCEEQAKLIHRVV